MLGLKLEPSSGSRLRILCIGAHCDDIEIGCGGALRVLQRRDRAVRLDYVVLSGTVERRREAQAAMERLVQPASRGRLVCGDFQDGAFPSAYGQVKAFFEAVKQEVVPDVIFCHERDDRHQDHRIVNEMVWNTFRDQLVLEYEVPKWDGGLSQPNVFVPLANEDAEAKIDALLNCYRSQVGRDWFTQDTFMALLRLRGLECRAPSGYAEAFHGRKLRLA